MINQIMKTSPKENEAEILEILDHTAIIEVTKGKQPDIVDIGRNIKEVITTIDLQTIKNVLTGRNIPAIENPTENTNTLNRKKQN